MYTEPGTYSIILTLSTGEAEDSVRREDFVTATDASDLRTIVPEGDSRHVLYGTGNGEFLP